MIVKVSFAAVRETRWYGYVIRFFFGGAITAIAGWIAHSYGPEVGGLFLAFPAIFPATATLVASHEKRKKQSKGMNGERRGSDAAAAEAAGAALGSLALLAFAAFAWQFLPKFRSPLVLAAATIVWMLLSVIFWVLWRRLKLSRIRGRRHKHLSAQTAH